MIENFIDVHLSRFSQYLGIINELLAGEHLNTQR